ELDAISGELITAQLVPMQMRRFRLQRVSAADAKLLCNLVSELGKPWGTAARMEDDSSLTLEWP
ncbi:MAG: poly-gamma-glutamate biosynthesis protein, partial [Verrucomicrobia bacterium]